MSERLREARADGHLEGNPALFDLLAEQAQLKRRIATLEARLRRKTRARFDTKGLTAPTGGRRYDVMRVVNDRDVEASEAVAPAASADGAERVEEERRGLTRY